MGCLLSCLQVFLYLQELSINWLKKRSQRPSQQSFPQQACQLLPPDGLCPRFWFTRHHQRKIILPHGGVDAKVNIRIWETFLRKYNITFRIVSSIEQLEGIQSGVLLLPSSVALSEREKQAVIGFRAKGGSVLASWLTGVRNEKGEWRGFDFMANALDTMVVGNTEEAEDDTFMMPYGDSPITHHLPAGLRVWLARPKEWYPLRLIGRHPAAQIMDWSRAIYIRKTQQHHCF